MTTITKEILASTMKTLISNFEEELFSKTQGQLEENWFFKFDEKLGAERNIYIFYERLKLYGSFVRRWEEHHNGNCCVVERVRDKYLWPKIKQFADDLRKYWDNNVKEVAG